MKFITMWMFYKYVTVLNQMCQIQIVWKIGYNFCTIVDKCKIFNVIIYCQNASEVQMQNNVCEWILDTLKMALLETKEKQKRHCKNGNTDHEIVNENWSFMSVRFYNRRKVFL